MRGEDRRHETLRLRVRELLAHRVDEGGRTAHVDVFGLDVRGGDVVGTEAPDEVRGRGLTRVAVQHGHIGHLGRGQGQLVAVARLLRRAGVVHEHHAAAVTTRTQGAEHRHHRGDTGAAGHQQHGFGQGLGKGELATHRIQTDHQAATGMRDQVGRDHTAVVPSDRQLQVAVALAAGDRVRPGTSASVDLDGDVDVLAGPEPGHARPKGAVGVQRQRDAARRVAPHPDDPGTGLAPRPCRVDQLGVTVHSVRTGEQVQQRGAPHPLGQAFSKHMFTVGHIG